MMNWRKLAIPTCTLNGSSLSGFSFTQHALTPFSLEDPESGSRERSDKLSTERTPSQRTRRRFRAEQERTKVTGER